MLANGTTLVNMVAFVYRPIRGHYANAVIWNMRVLTVKEVNFYLNFILKIFLELFSFVRFFDYFKLIVLLGHFIFCSLIKKF